jgi:hypothetical protein
VRRWERLEEFLFSADDSGTKVFTNRDVADAFGMAPRSATELIKAYQQAMVRPDLDTLFAIRREGRTVGTVWHIGHSTKDARALLGQFTDDVENRVTTVIAPMVQHITTLNPKAQPQATKITIRIGRLIQSLGDLGK